MIKASVAKPKRSSQQRHAVQQNRKPLTAKDTFQDGITDYGQIPQNTHLASQGHAHQTRRRGTGAQLMLK